MGDLAACMVCSVETEDNKHAAEMDVELIPNKELLTPETPHPAHELCFGLLLDMTIVETKKDTYHGKVCGTCLNDLKDVKTPVMALANGSWVGPVPSILEDLTITEQTLIALHPHTTYHIEFRGEASSPQPIICKHTVHPMAAECEDPVTCLPATLVVLNGAFDITYPNGFCLNDATFKLLMVR